MFRCLCGFLNSVSLRSLVYAVNATCFGEHTAIIMYVTVLLFIHCVFLCWMKHCSILKVRNWTLILIIEIQVFITWRLVKLVDLFRLRCFCVAVFLLCLLVGGWRLSLSFLPSVIVSCTKKDAYLPLFHLYEVVYVLIHKSIYLAIAGFITLQRHGWYMTYYVWCHILLS